MRLLSVQLKKPAFLRTFLYRQIQLIIIIIDIEDKTTASPKPYTKENLVEYEIMTRDNRIGEITNVATSIENKYTNNPDIKSANKKSSRN